jgi:hypothetical protein
MSTESLPSSIVEQLQEELRRVSVDVPLRTTLASLYLDPSGTLSKRVQEWTIPLAAATKQCMDAMLQFDHQLRSVLDISETCRAFQNELASWSAKQTPFFEDLAKWAEDSRSFLEGLEQIPLRFERMFQNAGQIGKHGWTVGENMDLPVMLRLSECLDRAEADAFMLEWYETHDPDLGALESRILSVKQLEPFRIGLTQAFSIFRSGYYAVAIPFLIPVFEQSLRHLAEPRHYRSTNVTRTVMSRYKEQEEHDPTSAYVMLSLCEFTGDLYQQYQDEQYTQTAIFRHGIQHGFQVPPDQKIEVIRLFHVIATVTECYGMGEIGGR